MSRRETRGSTVDGTGRGGGDSAAAGRLDRKKTGTREGTVTYITIVLEMAPAHEADVGNSRFRKVFFRPAV